MKSLYQKIYDSDVGYSFLTSPTAILAAIIAFLSMRAIPGVEKVHDDGYMRTVQYVTGELQPRMPQGGEPLSENDITILRNWIATGMKDDSPG